MVALPSASNTESPETDVSGARINAYLICGGRYHDFDFARLELLKILHRHDRIRVRVAENYSDIDALNQADFLVSYTCDVLPDQRAEEALQSFVAGGKRWHALHATNSIIEWTAGGKARSPRKAQTFMKVLGSQFIAHPPVAPFRVHVTDPGHPLMSAIGGFEVSDELYLSEMHGPNHVLLHTHYNGKAQDGFAEENWFSDEARPIMYLHPVGKGEVLYNTLGHCRGKYDMQPLIEEYPLVERCAWELPVYYQLLERGMRWAARLDD